MKTSFITTVKNEEKTIIPFLQSLYKQSVLPSEVIIADANSTDSTVKKIHNFFRNHKKIPYRIIIKDGNRSVGRNSAIKAAKNNVILCSDAGCIFEKNWVKYISQPFHNKKISIVSGYYKPITTNDFQKGLAAYTSILPQKLHPDTFLPSTRSIAFTKTAWKSVKGFPENLNTCEDMIFDKKLKEKNFQFYFEKNAIVYWPQRKNLFEAFVQFFTYAKGDGLAHYFRPQTPLLFVRYMLGILLVVLAIRLHSKILLSFIFAIAYLYILWSIKKNYFAIKSPKALFLLPMLQLTSDIAVLSGTTLGILLSTKL